MWALPLVLAACLLTGGDGYFFESGFTHHYTYWAENSLFGQDNITTVLKFHVSPVNETEEGHRLHSLTVDSLVQYAKHGTVLNNPLHWDLTKTFLFTVDNKGNIVLVHCHPQDHEELLVIKKAMVSVFSVTVKIEEDQDQWQYTAEETDHLGRLEHTYKAQKTEDGLKLHRNFSSSQDAFRFHEKTLHYDHRGTLKTAEAKDRVHFKDRGPARQKPPRLPGEVPHKITVSGDFPDIEASATVRMTLDAKQPVTAVETPIFHNLSLQTLETKQKQRKHGMATVQQNITKAFDCLQRFPEKDDVNRSLCVNDLRTILQELNTDDYRQFVRSYLGNRCQVSDTVCRDRRHVIIDVVTRMGDVTSQQLIIAHVLSKQPPVDEELRRVFAHCVVIERPIQKFVRSVESLCFGPDGEHHGTRHMTRTQTRACLAVGSLTHNLAKSGRHVQANRLTDRLESWLEVHGEADHHLSKRSTWLEDTVDESHHISKAVLLHALGNAALTRSRRHLMLHAQPNRGHQVWRRAALDALRHYTCEESADALLDSLQNDDFPSVREMALSVYSKHPRRRDVVRNREDLVLSRNYTYHSVTRVKRDIFEKVLLKFRVEVPKYEWMKEVGTKEVGGSFGVYFNNYIDAMFKVLNGYVDVNVHDKVWAELHIGLIDRQWDIFLAEACYKGRLFYNMNIFKDFTIGGAKDLASEFDHIAKRVMEPMEKAVNDLATKYQDPETNETKSGFDPLAKTIKHLPTKMQDALQSAVAFAEAAEGLSGHPLATKIKQLSDRAQSLLEDANSETTDLFSQITDAAVVGLPFAEKEIRNSINTILEKLGDVDTAPNQVMSIIERGKNGFQLAMQRIVKGNSIIKQATGFLSGSRTSFLNAGEELTEVVHQTRELMARLKAMKARRKTRAAVFSDFGQDLESNMDEAIDFITDSSDKMVDRMLSLTTIGKEVQEGFDKKEHYVEMLKNSYESVKEAVDMIKSRVSALFGQQFHPSFPNQRRDCDSTCGCGYFTGDCHYGHPGVDLKWNEGWGIPSPVAGRVTHMGDNSIIIEPLNSDFTDYEIIISNIIPNISFVDGEAFVDAGEMIGTPVGKSGCEDAHFHLAMKRKTTAVSTDLCYYLDPSPFLSVVQPIPVWQQDCKEFTFRHILQVIDFRSLTAGFATIIEELKRIAIDIGNNLLVKVVKDVTQEITGAMRGIAAEIVQGIDVNPSNLKNVFKQGGRDAAKSFYQNISSTNFSISKIVDMAKKNDGDAGNSLLQRSLSNVTTIIGQAQDFIKKPALNKLVSFGTGGITRFLSARGLTQPSESGGEGYGSKRVGVDAFQSPVQSGVSGTGSAISGEVSGILPGQTSELKTVVSGKVAMLTALKSSPCSMCPSFKNALAATSQSMCVPHDDCLGIDCDVTIPGSSFVPSKIDISVTVDPEEEKVNITSQGIDNFITRGGVHTIGGFKVARTIDVKFQLNVQWRNKIAFLSLRISACGLGFCSPDIPLMKNISFVATQRHKRSISSRLGNLASRAVDYTSKVFADFNFPMNDISFQFTGIQESMTESLFYNIPKKNATYKMSSEFKNPLDRKDNGSFPERDEDGDFYLEFFKFMLTYPLGPCLFRIDFTAGGAFGVAFDIEVKAIDSYLRAAFRPWISGKLTLDFSLSAVVAKAGVVLKGYLLRTGFPLSITTNYTKQPVVITAALEVELIPIELRLDVYLEIFWLMSYSRTIWHWSTEPLRGTIWKRVLLKLDRRPPRIQYCNLVDEDCVGGMRRRSASAADGDCNVYQVLGRHPHDAAFKLEFSAEDEDSDLKLWYAIGDYPGGTNVAGWTEMKGAALLVPAVLPCGIPLYFLVRARNSQGLETTGRCSVPTYDCTFPDGRVDAAYRCSSHPSKLSANVILFEDSELKQDRLFHAVGYSPSSYGHEVVDWLPLTLSNSQPQAGVSGDLRHFSPPRSGRLTSTPKTTVQVGSSNGCASECMKMSTCVSFSYSQHTQNCELQEVTEGAYAERKTDKDFVTYERLGNALNAVLRYEDLPLRHGTRYYVNTDIQNVLGYRATLTSEGTMIDFTPPEPGNIGEPIKDELLADGCSISILQRCVDHVKSSINHRLVIDGAGSTAVLNGNRRGRELRFTIENYHASANWEAFKDEECGLHGYTFAVGSTVCGDDVARFTDPHTHISNKDDWTHTGLVTNLHLPDGQYFVTVQAVSDIIHGGDLVTTVCHSTPFVVDTTPPSVNSVEQPLFDETFRFLVVYYNATDNMSGVARMEFGLGRTKYDVSIRKYLPFEIRGRNDNTYLVNEEFETEEGVPAWVRLKVVNNVELSATGSSSAPIIIDSTPPEPGDVIDGAQPGRDICCQNSTTQICAQWSDFLDPHSHIDRYEWGVGVTPGKDDVVAFHPLSSYTKHACVHVQLEHNVTYFSTVVAFNKALNQKSSNATSDGLLVDDTPPVPGTVSDGTDVTDDVNFTSETATVSATWRDFRDPESGLRPYSLSVYVNDRLQKTFSGILKETLTDHSFSLQHRDRVTAELRATNRAGGSVTVSTEGMLVDHTPPELLHLQNVNQTRFQQRDDILHFSWRFEDGDSGISQYRCVIYQHHQGRKTKYWPSNKDMHTITLNASSSTEGELDLDGLKLENGAAYTLGVTAINRAKIATAAESEPVTVDTTPPEIMKVSLSRPREEEEVNDGDQVEHVDGEPLWVTWDPRDEESGVASSHVCIGLQGVQDCTLTLTKTFSETLVSTTSFNTDELQVSGETTFLYQVYVVVENGAGLQSAVAASRPFLVLKANVAGVVRDGKGQDDVDFSQDMAAIAITFSGFESEACGIVGYEWGVGTAPYATDVLPYSDFGLVLDDQGTGFAQAHVRQIEGQTYYSSVRAKTGHNCHEPYIVSSSDGFTVDTTPPAVTFHVGSGNLTSEQVVYQTEVNTLEVIWKAEDASGINETVLNLDIFGDNPKTIRVPAVSTNPIALSPHPVSGDSIFSTLAVSDNAGNTVLLPLPPVTFDDTPPVLADLKCTEAIGHVSSIVACTWGSLKEEESQLVELQFGLGSGPSLSNLLNLTSVPVHSLQWTTDAQNIILSHNLTEFYVIVQVGNSAGHITEFSTKVVIDMTAPVVDNVTVVTSPRSGPHNVEQECQTSQDYIEVLLQGVEDEESSIARVELALGSSVGRTDIRPFRQYPLLHGIYAISGLGLQTRTAVYVTARVTNSVGLHTIATSHGVAISPEPRVEVWDGGQDSDMDGQSELHVMQGTWRYSDPCPVLSVEWALRELGGAIVTSFTEISSDRHEFSNDALSLENGKVYVNYIRIRDAANRIFTAFSDGITVLIREPEAGTVRDGLTPADQDFQEPTDHLSANWDVFGDPDSTLPSDQIVRYEAAVGTDSSFDATRADVHGFVDIGLATNFTFYGLNLTAKTTTYYVTVRAHSGAGSVQESSSDGIKVGYSADVTPGEVQADRYQSSVSSIRFSWTDFVSDMVITHYFVGVSSTEPPWDNATCECVDLLYSEFSFDVYPLQTLDSESVAVIEGLTLLHKASYYLIVIAENEVSQCSAAISGPITVDTTPPIVGKINVEGMNTDTAIFLHSEQTVVVSLDGFPDPESGVVKMEVELVESESCTLEESSSGSLSLRKVQAFNESHISLRNLNLQENTLYFLRVSVTNGVDLQTTATSLPLMLDATPPLPGLVKLGTDWTAPDRTFQKETQSLTGMVALKSLSSQADCSSQVSLLSAESKSKWRPMLQNFTGECVALDDLGLSVFIQHNAFLTGVDRGAAQYTEMPLREGDYVFRISPATGKKILTGIALHSPSLHPPFLSQNKIHPEEQSDPSCDPSVSVCMDNSNSTTSEQAMLRDGDYGVGLSFLEYGGQVKLLFWGQDILKLKQTWIALDFDPAQRSAQYGLHFQKTVSSGRESWEVEATVNGVASAGISGLVFPGTFVLTVYGWNMDNYFPSITDTFNPFRVSTVVSSLSIPVENPPLCSYGKPFHDRLTGIKEIWLGVSDDTNATANVAPYTLRKSFCLPCLRGCQNICSACSKGSVSGDFTITPLAISGLLLQAANEVKPPNTSSSMNQTFNGSDSQELDREAQDLKNFQLPTYYLDVRVVDHSGLATEVKSMGVVVDTSPPVINSLYCTNPEYMADAAVLYLGNNHTVGVRWDVTEDVSGVMDVTLCIGTQPGLDDVAQKTLVNSSKTEHVFENLSLGENSIYFVTLEVGNQAGLTSEAWSNFTVKTAPPEMSSVTVTFPKNVTVVKLGEQEVGLIENTEHLELNLAVDAASAEDLDVKYFELGIGTDFDKADIFPQTAVGSKYITKVAIVDGFLERNDVSEKASIGDYTKTNYTADTQPDPTANRFKLEPGRCLLPKLYGVSKAHVQSALELPPICVRRPEDVILEADSTEHELSLNSDKSVSVDRKDASSGNLKVKLKLSKGSMMAGVLQEKDLDTQYGSSASTEFSPFIRHPDPETDPTSRWLRKRLTSVPGPALFLSPVPGAEFSEDIDIKYTVPSSLDIPDNSFVMLMFWNPEIKEWKTSQETCHIDSGSFDKTTRLVSSKLCPGVFSAPPESSRPSLHKRRSTTNSLSTTSHSKLGPRMVIVAIIGNSTVNLPPVVNSTFFAVTEDNEAFNYTILYTDDEGDAVVFTVEGQPPHGTAEVINDVIVQYRPDEDFFGIDVIHMKGQEDLDATSLALGVVPNTITFDITVNVTQINDPPEVMFLAETGSVVAKQVIDDSTIRNGFINVSVFIEGNTTSLSVLGLIVFTDADDNDVISYIEDADMDDGAEFLVQDASPDDPRLPAVPSNRAKSAPVKEITLLHNITYNGRVTYLARGNDSSNAYSRLLTLDVHVLISPCSHGNCKPRDSNDTCLDPRRAFTFDLYTCDCDLGYEGQWCETETNECLKATCSPITDCVDLIGAYRCDYNPSKMAAIVLCPVLAALLGIFAFFKLKKRKPTKVEPMPKSDTADLKAGSKESHLLEPISVISTVEQADTMEQETFAEPEENKNNSSALSDPFFAYVPTPNPEGSRTSMVSVKEQDDKEATRKSKIERKATATETPESSQGKELREKRPGTGRVHAADDAGLPQVDQ